MPYELDLEGLPYIIDVADDNVRPEDALNSYFKKFPDHMKSMSPAAQDSVAKMRQSFLHDKRVTETQGTNPIDTLARGVGRGFLTGAAGILKAPEMVKTAITGEESVDPTDNIVGGLKRFVGTEDAKDYPQKKYISLMDTVVGGLAAAGEALDEAKKDPTIEKTQAMTLNSLSDLADKPSAVLDSFGEVVGQIVPGAAAGGAAAVGSKGLGALASGSGRPAIAAAGKFAASKIGYTTAAGLTAGAFSFGSEGAGAQEEALARGDSPQEAAIKGSIVGSLNAALDVATPLKIAKRFARGGKTATLVDDVADLPASAEALSRTQKFAQGLGKFFDDTNPSRLKGFAKDATTEAVTEGLQEATTISVVDERVAMLDDNLRANDLNRILISSAMGFMGGGFFGGIAPIDVQKDNPAQATQEDLGDVTLQQYHPVLNAKVLENDDAEGMRLFASNKITVEQLARRQGLTVTPDGLNDVLDLKGRTPEEREEEFKTLNRDYYAELKDFPATKQLFAGPNRDKMGKILPGGITYQDYVEGLYTVLTSVTTDSIFSKEEARKIRDLAIQQKIVTHIPEVELNPAYALPQDVITNLRRNMPRTYDEGGARVDAPQELKAAVEEMVQLVSAQTFEDLRARGIPVKNVAEVYEQKYLTYESVMGKLVGQGNAKDILGFTSFIENRPALAAGTRKRRTYTSMWNYKAGTMGILMQISKRKGDASTIVEEYLHAMVLNSQGAIRGMLERRFAKKMEKWGAEEHEAIVKEALNYIMTGKVQPAMTRTMDILAKHFMLATKMTGAIQSTPVSNEALILMENLFGFTARREEQEDALASVIETLTRSSRSDITFPEDEEFTAEELGVVMAGAEEAVSTTAPTTAPVEPVPTTPSKPAAKPMKSAKKRPRRPEGLAQTIIRPTVSPGYATHIAGLRPHPSVKPSERGFLEQMLEMGKLNVNAGDGLYHVTRDLQSVLDKGVLTPAQLGGDYKPSLGGVSPWAMNLFSTTFNLKRATAIADGLRVGSRLLNTTLEFADIDHYFSHTLLDWVDDPKIVVDFEDFIKTLSSNLILGTGANGTNPDPARTNDIKNRLVDAMNQGDFTNVDQYFAELMKGYRDHQIQLTNSTYIKFQNLEQRVINQAISLAPDDNDIPAYGMILGAYGSVRAIDPAKIGILTLGLKEDSVVDYNMPEDELRVVADAGELLEYHAPYNTDDAFRPPPMGLAQKRGKPVPEGTYGKDDQGEVKQQRATMDGIVYHQRGFGYSEPQTNQKKQHKIADILGEIREDTYKPTTLKAQQEKGAIFLSKLGQKYKKVDDRIKALAKMNNLDAGELSAARLYILTLIGESAAVLKKSKNSKELLARTELLHDAMKNLSGQLGKAAQIMRMAQDIGVDATVELKLKADGLYQKGQLSPFDYDIMLSLLPNAKQQKLSKADFAQRYAYLSAVLDQQVNYGSWVTMAYYSNLLLNFKTMNQNVKENMALLVSATAARPSEIFMGKLKRAFGSKQYADLHYRDYLRGLVSIPKGIGEGFREGVAAVRGKPISAQYATRLDDYLQLHNVLHFMNAKMHQQYTRDQFKARYQNYENQMRAAGITPESHGYLFGMVPIERWKYEHSRYQLEKAMATILPSVTRLQMGLDVFFKVIAETNRSTELGLNHERWQKQDRELMASGQQPHYVEDNVRVIAEQNRTQDQMQWSNQEWADYIDAATQDPTLLFKDVGKAFAEEITGQQLHGETVRGYSKMINSIRIGKLPVGKFLISPFININIAMMKWGATTSPVFGVGVGAALKMPPEKILARQVTGLLLGYLMMKMRDDGWIVGPAPVLPHARAQFFKDGLQPNSFRYEMGGEVHYKRMPAFLAMAMAPWFAAADQIDRYNENPNVPLSALVQDFAEKTFNTFLEASPFQSLGMYLGDNAQDRLSTALRPVDGFIPFSGLMQDLIEGQQILEDGYVTIKDTRLKWSDFDKIDQEELMRIDPRDIQLSEHFFKNLAATKLLQKDLPWFHHEVPNKISGFGEVIEKDTLIVLSPQKWFGYARADNSNFAYGAAAAVLGGVETSMPKPDRVETEWTRLNMYPSLPDDVITVEGLQYQMRPNEYRQFAVVTGIWMKRLTNQKLRDPNWISVPDETKKKVLESIRSASVEAARDGLLRYYPEIRTALRAQAVEERAKYMPR